MTESDVLELLTRLNDAAPKGPFAESSVLGMKRLMMRVKKADVESIGRYELVTDLRKAQVIAKALAHAAKYVEDCLTNQGHFPHLVLQDIAKHVFALQALGIRYDTILRVTKPVATKPKNKAIPS